MNITTALSKDQIILYSTAGATFLHILMHATGIF